MLNLNCFKQKKCIAFLCFSFAGSMSLANGQFYLGAQLGYSMLSLYKYHTYFYENTTAKDSSTASGDGALENLLFGYHYRFKRGYDLGAAVYVGLSQAQEDSRNDYHYSRYSNNSHTYTQLKQQYGVFIKPGYWVRDNTLFYATLGLAHGYFAYRHIYRSSGQPDDKSSQNTRSWGMDSG